MALNVIMMGPPGAGKGTQAERFARERGLLKISTGEILREAVQSQTPLGCKAKATIDAGKLVDDATMIGIVRERLLQPDAMRGFVLDGFPRTVGQAEALSSFTAGLPLDVVINLDVPEEVVLRRLASRRVCADCGTNYSVSQPPRYDWTCDVCGGRVVQRDDDTEEAIRERLQTYERETAPLIAWYGQQDLLVPVSGLGTPDEVTDRLVRAIDGRAGVRAASRL